MSDIAPYLDAFPPADEAQWRARVEGVLKGKPFETLVGKTYDGLAVQPLYPPAFDAAPVARAARGWQVVQRMDQPDSAAANKQALDDLGNGADGLQLVFEDGLGAHGFGLPLEADAVERALAGVVFDAEIPIEIDALDPRAASLLADVVERAQADPAATRIAFGVDPFGPGARGAGAGLRERGSALAAQARELKERGFAGPFFVADARLVHAAGGSEAQELAYALAAALDCVRLMDAAGMAIEEAPRLVSFRLAMDTDEFLGVAKLRALRRLWASVEEECGVPSAPAHIHAETAWRAMTRRDADVNILRATLGVFSAGVGGADRVTVLPHTQALGLPDPFARRVARNIQLVLAAEANLGKVADPAAGSGGFEALTDALCERAWDAFQRIERAGGLEAALASGAFRTEVETVAAARAKNIARRRDAVTGVSEFPNLGEVAPTVLEPLAPHVDDTPFAPRRLAEPFEALRDRADAVLARTGKRPSVFLAVLGSVASATPRLTFAKNLFEVGGFAAIPSEGGDDFATLGEAFARSGATTVCLCGSDAVYAEVAEAAARALAEAGATRIVLAGRSGDAEARLRAAGVTDFAHAGADVLALLRSLSSDGAAA